MVERARLPRGARGDRERAGIEDRAIIRIVGADDNASVTVGLLGVARAFVKQPGRRSALFVFHGAEERGLIGSRWFVAHPTVPLAKIVAVVAMLTTHGLAILPNALAVVEKTSFSACGAPEFNAQLDDLVAALAGLGREAPPRYAQQLARS